MGRMLLGRMSDHEPWWAEWWSAVAALGWVLTLSLFTPGMDSSPTFWLVADLAPPWFWYGFSGGLALGQMWALRTDHRKLRWWLALAMGWWWMFVGMAVAVAVPLAPSVALYAAMAFINHYSVLRLRTD